MDHLTFRRKSPSPRQGASQPASNSHKTMKQNVDRMDQAVSAIPQTLGDCMDNFSAFCQSGVKFASFMETVLQDTPTLLLALRFREVCEQMNDKCKKSAMMLNGEVVPPVKTKLVPSLVHLKKRLDSHAKAVSKHEHYAVQLENLGSAQNTSKQKLDQVEGKFKAAANDFAKEDSKLVEALNEVHRMRVEVMGPCFLSFLETQSKLLAAASDLMAPLGAYKEVGKGLSDSSSDSALKEATVGWLAAAQVNQNLRSFGSLSRNDVQCMMYNQSDGLPGTISNGLNTKVDQLLKKYVSELKQSPNRHHKVIGGFHLNPKGIELALRDCCSALEAQGAGAPHAETKAEKESQIDRDVPRTSYKVLGEKYGCAMGENVEANIREKQEAIVKLLQTIQPRRAQNSEDGDKEGGVDEDKMRDFAFHVLNESCTTVTNTAAKTAVQLVFGKANLVLVRPSPQQDDNHPIELLTSQADSSVSIIVQSSWWLVEDYATFAMLSRPMNPSASLGEVDVTYTLNLKLENFLQENPALELPSIAVTYHESPVVHPSQSSSSPKASRERHRFLRTLRPSMKSMINRPPPPPLPNQDRDYGGRGREQGEMGYLRVRDPDEREGMSSGSSSHSGSPGGGERSAVTGGGKEAEEGEEEGERGRKREGRRGIRQGYGEGMSEMGAALSNPLSAGSRGHGGRSDSLGRGQRPGYYQLKKYPSNDSLSSSSTLVSKLNAYEHDDNLVDILRPASSGQGLTQSNVQDHLQFEARKNKRLRSRPPRQATAEEEQGGPAYGYMRRREKFVEGRERSDRVGDDGRGRERRGKEEVDGREDEDSTSPTMHVSPASDDQRGSIHVASDAEMQTVIEFLSHSQSGFDESEADGGNHYSSEQYGYQEAPGYLAGNQQEWGQRRKAEPNKGHPPPSDNGSSGSSGVGMDDGYNNTSNDAAGRSRSTSMSPGMDGKEFERHSGRGKEEGLVEDGSFYNMKGSPDSGINIHSRPSKRKGWDREPENLDRSHSQDLPIDLSKGLGPLIPSNPRRQGGPPSDLSYSMDMLNLDYLKRITGDSDSERSGRDSIPLVSSSSSEAPSPLLGKTKSMDDITHQERSSSRNSNNALPFPGQEDPFNHAPGSQLPHHNRTYPFSGLEYDTTHSQDFYDCGSHSQGWDWPGLESGPSRPRPDLYNSHSYGYEDSLAPGHSRAGRYGSPGPTSSHSQQERQSRPLHRMPMSRSQEDYPHSFAPPPSFDPRHNMMPPPRGPMRMGGPYGLPLPGPGGPMPNQGPPPGPGMGGPMHHPLPPQGPPPFRGPGPLPPHHVPRGPMPPPPHHSPAMMGPRGLGGPHGPAGPLHGPPPPHHPGGPGPPWYENPFDSPRLRGPPPPNPHQFRPVPFAGRSNTPSDAPSPASLPSMSPGPSPHPTPPPTPPPNMGGPHGPPIPGPHHPGPPGPPMGIPHMSRPPPMRGPPPMWEGGPGPRDFGPGPPMQGGRGPPMSLAPSPNIPGPPIYSGGGGPRYHMEWDRNPTWN